MNLGIYSIILNKMQIEPYSPKLDWANLFRNHHFSYLGFLQKVLLGDLPYGFQVGTNVPQVTHVYSTSSKDLANNTQKYESDILFV